MVSHQLIIFATIYVTAYAGPDCPIGMFEVISDRECKSDNCIGECIDIFTCCSDLCFTRNMTRSLTDACNISQDTSNKSCSQHDEEMRCISNITNSTPTICHEQLRWMTKRGESSFAPDDLENCPCEHGYGRIDAICTSDVCRNTGDCYNTTDTYYNTDTCCYNDSLNPTDDICDDEEEVIAVIFVDDVYECNSSCIQLDSTCKTSNTTFSACCQHKSIPPVSTKKKDPIDGAADGFVVPLVVAIIVIIIAGCVTIGIYIFRKKFMKKPVDDKTKVLGLESIEEDVHDDDWTNLAATSGDTNMEARIAQQSISNQITEEDFRSFETSGVTFVQSASSTHEADEEVRTFETTAIINPRSLYREADTPPMQDLRLSSDESSDSTDDIAPRNNLTANNAVRSVNEYTINDHSAVVLSDQTDEHVIVEEGSLNKSETDPNIPTTSSFPDVIQCKRKFSCPDESINSERHKTVMDGSQIENIDEQHENGAGLFTDPVVITKPIRRNLNETYQVKPKDKRKVLTKLRRRSDGKDSNTYINSKEAKSKRFNRGREKPENKDIELEVSIRRSVTAPSIFGASADELEHKQNNGDSEYKTPERVQQYDYKNEHDIATLAESAEEDSEDSGVLNSSFSSSSGINMTTSLGVDLAKNRNLRSTTPLSAFIGGAIDSQLSGPVTDID